MSMQKIKCPYCGSATQTSSINDKIIMSKVTKTYSKCHKSFSWQGEYGCIKYERK